MFSMLPDLTPRDSHSLWYTSRRNPSSLYHLDPSHHNPIDGTNPTTNTAPTTTTPNPTQNTPAPPTAPGGGVGARQGNNGHSASAAAQRIERSVLGRLQAEEQLMERRRTAVSNLGSTWLKPVGVSKTLFQMREERREAEEHAEAMRREMLAQELADAEAEAAAAAGGGGGEGEEEDEEEEDDDEDNEEDDEEEPEELSEGELERRQEIARIHAREVRMRQITEQSDANLRRSDDIFDFDEEPSEEERSQMLDEEDLVRGGPNQQLGSQGRVSGGAGHDMDMDADLDGDIPEAEGGYEHTDSEASLGSEDDGHDISYARSARAHRDRTSLRRSGVPRSSLDISGLLSRDGSSMMGSSPQMRRGNY
ncbi:Apc15p protein-domain-containing protein [Chaetomium tenue]|uniref:Apc15p protein-domain-containing protein n=1 Tax=Chaetomium tenue TaxID=1854479 RepID=A0ACB7NWU2_9PEZI|nr:Apc15p protein-domain-containing protein [Chaetomium globosum]